MISQDVSKVSNEYNLRWASANPALMVLALERMHSDFSKEWSIKVDFSRRGFVTFTATRT